MGIWCQMHDNFIWNARSGKFWFRDITAVLEHPSRAQRAGFHQSWFIWRGRIILWSRGTLFEVGAAKYIPRPTLLLDAVLFERGICFWSDFDYIIVIVVKEWRSQQILPSWIIISQVAKFQADFGCLTKVEVSFWGSLSLAAAPIIILEQHCVAEFLSTPWQIQVPNQWLLET